MPDVSGSDIAGTFGAAAAKFDGKPVPGEASFEGARYVFDGICGENVVGMVPDNIRVFGRLKYKAVDASKPVVALASPAPSSGT